MPCGMEGIGSHQSGLDNHGNLSFAMGEKGRLDNPSCCSSRCPLHRAGVQETGDVSRAEEVFRRESQV